MTDTQPPTLETLLRRWAELDGLGYLPALFGAHDAHFQVPVSRWIDAERPSYDEDAQDWEDRIQGAVQRAIEARGMWWALDNDVVDRKYAAVVNERRWGKQDWYGFSDDTPAAAILSAYLQALEAQQ